MKNKHRKVFESLNISLGNIIDTSHINKNDSEKYNLRKKKIELKDMNIGKIIYTINQKSPMIKIFGKGFVEINKNKAKIIKNYKLYNLKEEINNKKQNTKVEIKLKFLENMVNIDSMFKDCKMSSLVLSEFSNFNMKYLKNLQLLFCNCSSLKNIDDISDWNIKNVTNINELLSGCSLLEKLPDISNWKTNNVINMNKLFDDCSSLKSLPDISKWNTNKVTDLSFLLNGCSSLTSLPDLSKWNTNNVMDLSFLFNGCSSLTSLPNLSKWNINNVNNISSLFSGCSSLMSLPYISK